MSDRMSHVTREGERVRDSCVTQCHETQTHLGKWEKNTAFAIATRFNTRYSSEAYQTSRIALWLCAYVATHKTHFTSWRGSVSAADHLSVIQWP